MVGETISHYRILEKLGEGGMGAVYKAEDVNLGRSAALKFLLPYLADDGAIQRFRREAQAAAALSHSNVCTVYEIDTKAPHPFIALEFVDGGSVAERIKPPNGVARPLPLEEALEIAIQTASGLQAAHEKGITHRDIKSANILLTRAGQVKITDFGLAYLAERSRLTNSGTTLGTPAYMSPEQVLGKPTDRRTDIWSLGVVLYEMLTGRLPFASEYDQAILYSIMNESHEPLTAVRTGVPKELERIVDKALAKDAGARYQHVEEVYVDLRELIRRRESDAAVRTAMTAPVPVRTNRWHGLGGAAVVLAIMAAYWAGSGGTPTTSTDEPLRPVPFTAYHGSEMQATFSPDGNQVSFAWNGDNREQYDIYVKVVGTGKPLRLTTDRSDDQYPAWSPDGRWIAFCRLSEDEPAVYLVSPLGGDERKLTALSRRSFRWRSQLAWTPDGRSLIISDDEESRGLQTLYSVNIETGTRTAVTEPIGSWFGEIDPTVSPETGQIAFVRYLDGNRAAIHVKPLAGGTETEVLSPATREIMGLSWAGRGRQILFAEQFTGIWRISLDDQIPHLLTSALGSQAWPAVSRDGRRLIFGRSEPRFNIWRYSVATGNADQADGRKIATSTQAEMQAQISPNGRRIALVSLRTGQSEIWIAEADGSSATQLTSLGQHVTTTGSVACGSPRWSPDGRQIAFDARIDSPADIYVIDSQGGLARRLTDWDSVESRPSWSHDGGWIYFNSDQGGSYEIWKIPAGGGEAVQVTSNGGYNPVESPDGRYLYFGKRREPGIWRMPVEGGTETLVVADIEGAAQGYFDIANDGVYFIDRAGSSRYRQGWQLSYLDLGSGKPRHIANLPAPPAGAIPLDTAPDGSWFVYAQRDESDFDLMLVENFR